MAKRFSVKNGAKKSFIFIITFADESWPVPNCQLVVRQFAVLNASYKLASYKLAS